MKIALIYTDITGCFLPYPPVNLAYLAGQIEGLAKETIILDLNIESGWENRLFEFCSRQKHKKQSNISVK